ncbi:MAG: hypothetical protein M3R65_03375 [Gemmatimonadota bacterium]|nr:hypothetical protein [Gemmatimonadota bacterium]
MTRTLVKDVPAAAHAKAIEALDEFDRIIARYELHLDTQHALVRTANFAGLFEMASHGDRLVRDAAICGKRFTPLVGAVADGQFAGPRAAEIRRRSLASRSVAQTLDAGASRLADVCSYERDSLGNAVRQLTSSRSDNGLPPAYRPDPERFIDRRG